MVAVAISQSFAIEQAIAEALQHLDLEALALKNVAMSYPATDYYGHPPPHPAPPALVL